MDKLDRKGEGGAFYSPQGRLLVNKTKSLEIYYDSFMEPIVLQPGEERFVQSLKNLNVSTFFLSPELWNARQTMDELLGGREKISVLVDASSVDKFGDSIMLTVIPKAYKLAFEDKVKICVLVHDKVKEAWQENPFVEEVYTSSPKDEFDIVVDVNNLETKWKEGTFSSEKLYINRTEVYLENLGLALLNKTPVYVVSQEERKWAEELVRASKRPLVGMALFSAAKCRTYPRMVETANLIVERHVAPEVIYLDQVKKDGSFSFTFRQMAALVEQCDVIVTADSAVLHLAGALRKRVVGVFGGTGGKIFTEDYERATYIQATCPTGTSECWWKVPCLPGETYQEKMEAGEVPCLSLLEPSLIVDAVENQLTGPKKIFIAMLTFNCLEMTKRAISSIRSWHNYDLYVVDNDSTDGTQKWLSESGIRFISYKDSVAGAQSHAIKTMWDSPEKYDYLLLLNNDIALRRDTIDELVRNVGDEFKAVTSWPLQSIPPWSIDRYTVVETHMEPIIDIPPGAYSCTLFPARMIDRVGLNDVNFHPRYIEDNDYTLRIRLEGGTFWRSHSSVYYHVLGAVVKTDPTQKQISNITWDKNIDYYIEKWGFHPHEPQNFKRLGLEWFEKVNGKSILDDIQGRELKTVTIKRNMGGWGDHIFATVIARELKKVLPSITVKYAFATPYAQVLQRNPNIDALLSMGAHTDYDLTDVEFRYELQEMQKHGEIRTPRTLIYLKVFGLPTDNIKPDYFVSPEEKAWALKIWGDRKKRVAVVPDGSNNTKRWPHMDEFISIGRLADWRPELLDKKYTFRQAAALINQADVVISPDTGLSNVAGALGKQTLCIFGNRSGKPFEQMFGSAFQSIHEPCKYAGKNGCDYFFNCLGHGSIRQRERSVSVLDCMKDLSAEKVYLKVREVLG